MKTKCALVALAAIFAASLLTGCAAMVSRAFAELADGPDARYYPGTRVDIARVFSTNDLGIGSRALLVIDTPFSFACDTLWLPIELTQDIRR